MHSHNSVAIADTTLGIAASFGFCAMAQKVQRLPQPTGDNLISLVRFNDLIMGMP